MLVEGQSFSTLLGFVGGATVAGAMAAYLAALSFRLLAGWRLSWSDWTLHGSMIGGWGMTFFLIVDWILG